MRVVAVINSTYIRDAQLHHGDFTNEDEEWEDFSPTHFVGIFQDSDEDRVRRDIARRYSVHPNAINLIDITV